MTSIALKTINFESGAIDGKAVEFKFDGELQAESAKNLAYTVRWQLARRRAGTAKVKTMAEISGTTAKPHKQKGTGSARQGSKRSVQFVGGRTCHGPVPRSFDFAIPKKIVKKALSDALKIKLQENKIILFSEVENNAMKTAKLNSVLQKNNFLSVLIVFDSTAKNTESLIRAASNLKNVKTLDAKAINVYDILKFDQIIVDSKIFASNILTAL